MDVIDDLAAEEERLETILGGFGEEQWLAGSGAPGWSVADVVLHLAQTEEAVVTSVTSGPEELGGWFSGGGVDEAMDALVAAERAAPDVVFGRWRAARRAALDLLRAADPATPLPWVTGSLKPRTLATTRLAEHWAHGLDVVAPSGTPLPDTDRLRHVAWLAHSTLPYAFVIAGEEPGPVYCELTGPAGTTYSFGPADAGSTVTGSLGDFCRVGAQRLAPEASDLTATGPHGRAALRLLRNYAA